MKGALKAIKRSHAGKILDEGGTVTVAGKGASKEARKLAKDQWGDKAVRHDAHAEGQKPHYQHKNGGRGHINYVDKLGTIGVATFGDGIVGNVVDFFNPAADVKAVVDLVKEVAGGPDD